MHASAHGSPAVVQHLPPAIHAAYIAAYAAALHPVFLAAAAVMLGAFGLSWLLRDVPLRETAGVGRGRGRDSHPRGSSVQLIQMSSARPARGGSSARPQRAERRAKPEEVVGGAHGAAAVRSVWLCNRRGTCASAAGSRMAAARRSVTVVVDEVLAQRGVMREEGIDRRFLLASAYAAEFAARIAAGAPEQIDLVVTSPTALARRAVTVAVGGRWVFTVEEPLLAPRVRGESGDDVIARAAQALRGVSAYDASAPLIIFDSLDILGASVFVLDEDGLGVRTHGGSAVRVLLRSCGV